MKAAAVTSFSTALENVNAVIAEVLSGKIPARLVFDYATVPAAV